MKAHIEIHQSDLERMGSQVFIRINAAKGAVHEAMAKRCYEMVMGNFGIAGADRPKSWPRLSSAYAKKVKREIATLIVSGALKNAVKYESGVSSGKVSVSDSDVPYALVHQFGGGNNIPARPYFPIKDNGTLTSYTMSQVLEAGQDALNKAFAL